MYFTPQCPGATSPQTVQDHLALCRLPLFPRGALPTFPSCTPTVMAAAAVERAANLWLVSKAVLSLGQVSCFRRNLRMCVPPSPGHPAPQELPLGQRLLEHSLLLHVQHFSWKGGHNRDPIHPVLKMRKWRCSQPVEERSPQLAKEPSCLAKRGVGPPAHILPSPWRAQLDLESKVGEGWKIFRILTRRR